MEETAVSAYFTLIGDDFDVNYVTNVLDITPSETRYKDEILGNGRKFGHTEWGISTGHEVSLDINNQFNTIFALVYDKIDLLSQLCVECNAEWHILFVITIENGYAPAMYFKKDFIHFAAAIDAQIGFDTYIYSLDEGGYRGVE